MNFPLTIIVEQSPDSHEFLAYSDAVQCLATGDTAEDAIMHFRTALHDLVTHYRDALVSDLSRKMTRTVPLASCPKRCGLFSTDYPAQAQSKMPSVPR